MGHKDYFTHRVGKSDKKKMGNSPGLVRQNSWILVG